MEEVADGTANGQLAEDLSARPREAIAPLPDATRTPAPLADHSPSSVQTCVSEGSLQGSSSTVVEPALEENTRPNEPDDSDFFEDTEGEDGLEDYGDRPVGFWPVLQNRNFLILWSGQIFSQLADKVYLVLMISLIVSRFQTDNQPISGWVSAIMIAFTIPAILFGSIAGVFVDRWPKKAVLSITNLIRGGLVLTLPLALWVSSGQTAPMGWPMGFCLLLVITFLVSTLTQFFAPAEQAIMPLLVERHHLLSANSLYTTTMMASVIIGFAIGEPVLELAANLFRSLHLTDLFGGSPDVGKQVMVGASYAIAGLILLVLKPNEQEYDPNREHPHVWDDIRDGIRYLGKQQRVRAALIQLVLLFSIFAALAVLSVRMAEIMPAIDSDQFGFLLAAGGVGMGVGAALVGQYGQRVSRDRLSLYGSVGMAIALLSLSLIMYQQLWPCLVAIGSLGLFAAMIGVPMQTTIQAETPEEMRGKVFGLQNNAVNIALSLPLALAGIAESYLGLATVFVILAILVILGGLLTWYISHRGSRKTA
jgi:predicted MFS family arabinose efflux permease